MALYKRKYIRRNHYYGGDIWFLKQDDDDSYELVWKAWQGGGTAIELSSDEMNVLSNELIRELNTDVQTVIEREQSLLSEAANIIRTLCGATYHDQQTLARAYTLLSKLRDNGVAVV